MIKFVKRITVALAVVLFAAGSASATKFDFGGDWLLAGGTFSFLGNTVSQTTFIPAGDPIFSDAGIEYVTIGPLFGTEIAGAFVFSPTSYMDGFKLFDDTGVLLFDADLEVSSVIEFGTSGLINPFFTMNLTGISAGIGYVPGSSPIVDAFLLSPGGAMTITMNLFNSSGGSGTYSGSAAPVPEPSTLLLLGVSLMGIAGLARKKQTS